MVHQETKDYRRRMLNNSSITGSVNNELHRADNQQQHQHQQQHRDKLSTQNNRKRSFLIADILDQDDSPTPRSRNEALSCWEHDLPDIERILQQYSAAPSCIGRPVSSTMNRCGGQRRPSQQPSSLPPCYHPARQTTFIPAWVFCTRYSDRPGAGLRSRKPRQRIAVPGDSKRPRTAFNNSQLDRLRAEFSHSPYLTSERRSRLAHELQLNESQIKIWFQNKRAKLKKINVSATSPVSNNNNNSDNNNKDLVYPWYTVDTRSLSPSRRQLRLSYQTK